MAFDLGSFLLGWGAGLISGSVVRRMRPLAMELAAAVGQLTETATVGVAQQGERLQDLISEAKTAFQSSRAAMASRRSATHVPISDEPTSAPAHAGSRRRRAAKRSRRTRRPATQAARA